MKLGDILTEVGDAPLKGHGWTEGVLETLNQAIPAKVLLTKDNTGNEATAALGRLPTEDRIKLLVANVDLVTGVVTYDAGSVVAPPKKKEKKHKLLDEAIRNPRSFLALFVGLGMVAVALIMAISITVVSIHTGHQADSSFFKDFFKFFIDLLNLFGDHTHHANDYPYPAPPSTAYTW